jgi:hypothetical protein
MLKLSSKILVIQILVEMEQLVVKQKMVISHACALRISPECLVRQKSRSKIPVIQILVEMEELVLR